MDTKYAGRIMYGLSKKDLVTRRKMTMRTSQSKVVKGNAKNAEVI